MATFHRILVPVDGSPTSSKAFAVALQMAREAAGTVRVFHGIDEIAYLSGFEQSAESLREAREYAARLLEQAVAEARAAGVECDSRLVEAPARRIGELVADAAREWSADLVVVGTHGRRGISRLLMGSGAEQIIRLAEPPVLVIRGDVQ
jgi:nucleotide-binding universal stress UspA family protein